jgi:hypothetical protein
MMMVRNILLLLSFALAPLVVHAQDDMDCVAQGSPCHVDSRLKMLHIEDKQIVVDFLDALKTAARTKDRKAMSKLVSYPLSVNKKKKSVAYKTPATLLANFDTVFTPAVLEAIQRAEYEQLFVNIDGIMLGNGEIWCRNADGAIRIFVVNVP